MNVPLRSRVIEAIRAALVARGVDASAWIGDGLCVTKGVVTELSPTPLADLIVDAAFPAAATAVEYWHYTTAVAATSIIATRKFRLYAVTKCLSQGEYEPFCRDHHCTGYLDPEPQTGRPVFEGMCSDLFYGSFVRTGDGDEAHMWKVFGERRGGVRFRVRIQPTLQRAELRPVVYANQTSRTLVSAVMDAVAGTGAPQFVLRGISRIAAFYLRFDNSESETRLLIKRYAGGRPLPIHRDGALEYLPIPLQTDHELCRLDILDVERGACMTPCNEARFNAAWVDFKAAATAT